MEQYFVINRFLIPFKFFRSISVISSILSYTKVFNICNFVSLRYCEVRSIWFVRIEDIIWIRLLVNIVNIIN